MISVIGPFLPRYFTRKSFNVFKSDASLICVSASFFSVCNCSNIPFTPSF
ncbi:phenylalanyl-tRNA synthetase [Listeria monocytogenes]|nr:phenylalanyl-tRNA synthetase [Listeria monocytogenes]GAT40825.1 phenylalanyl-tRNA synthetase [Listeria monocytogenes]